MNERNPMRSGNYFKRMLWTRSQLWTTKCLMRKKYREWSESWMSTVSVLTSGEKSLRVELSTPPCHWYPTAVWPMQHTEVSLYIDPLKEGLSWPSPVTGPDSFSVRVVARREIPAGEEITIHYVPASLGQPARWVRLSSDWYFHCQCPRCLDVTEFGTFVSAIKCSQCREGLILAENSSERQIWRCRSVSAVTGPPSSSCTSDFVTSRTTWTWSSRSLRGLRRSWRTYRKIPASSYMKIFCGDILQLSTSNITSTYWVRLSGLESRKGFLYFSSKANHWLTVWRDWDCTD